MTMNVSMESQCAGRTIIDFCQPTLNHTNITDYLLVYMFWHDAIQYIWHWKDHLLGQLGQQGADEDKLISELTTFVAACYGSKVEGYMTTHRYQNVEV